jgi:hypothetical protein
MPLGGNGKPLIRPTSTPRPRVRGFQYGLPVVRIPPNRHVQQRMQERDIAEWEIDQVLANPGTTYPSLEDEGRTVILGSTEEGRRLKVVVLQDDWEEIITVADRDLEE